MTHVKPSVGGQTSSPLITEALLEKAAAAAREVHRNHVIWVERGTKDAFDEHWQLIARAALLAALPLLIEEPIAKLCREATDDKSKDILAMEGK